MTLRAIPLITMVAAFLSIGIVHAADVPNSIGSTVKTEDAISESREVFVGLLIILGEQDKSVDHPSIGPE